MLILTRRSLLRPREQLRSIVMSMSVCLCLCPRGYLQNHTRDLCQIFVLVTYVRGSVVLRCVDDRPHRLSAGRGDGSAQCGQSVIYDCSCFSAFCLLSIDVASTGDRLTYAGFNCQLFDVIRMSTHVALSSLRGDDVCILVCVSVP